MIIIIVIITIYRVRAGLVLRCTLKQWQYRTSNCCLLLSASGNSRVFSRDLNAVSDEFLSTILRSELQRIGVNDGSCV